MSAVVKDRLISNPSLEINPDEVDLGDLLGVLIENRVLIAAMTFLALFLGTIYAFTATPIYQADGLLQVEEKKGGLGDLDIGSLFEGDTSINAEIEILRSRMVLGDVVDNLKLEIQAWPDYFPIFGAAVARRASASQREFVGIDSLDVPAELVGNALRLVAKSGGRYQLLSEEDEHLLNGTVGEVASVMIAGEPLSIFVSELRADPGDTFSIGKQSRLRAIEALQGSLVISERGKGSGILSMVLSGANPKMISREINEIANVYVRQNVERKSAEAQKTLAFLEQQLPVVKQRMEAAEVSLNSYRLEKGSIDLPLETQAILGTIVTVEGKLNGLQQERDKVTQAFTPSHPMVIALDRQIERLQGELEEYDEQVHSLPVTQQEVLRLVRDVEVDTVLYTSLLNTSQELRVVKAGTVGNVRVIDYAVAPHNPIKPKKVLVLVLSLMVGAFLGVVTAFVRRALHGGVEDPDLIEKHVNIPIYATVVHSRHQDRIFRKLQEKETASAILAVDYPEDVAVESLRNLRTALHFGMMDSKNNCIMIAGPSPMVGKSFVSVNLAAVLTGNGKKVLVIDGDMRRGRLHEYLGVERKNGLSDFISGEIPIGQALHQTTIAGLTVIPTGKIPPNPAELLLHKRFTNCLSVLTPRFDHIIIDSPPVLAVTDATIIGQMAGATLMVLKAGEHPMREIDLAVRRLQQAGVNLRGLLINDIDAQSQRYGSAKYHYQYSYTK